MGEEPSPTIAPSRTFMATKAPGVLKPPSAASPASCTRLSIVSSRLSPARGSDWLSTPPVGWPWASTWTRVLPFAPRSTVS